MKVEFVQRFGGWYWRVEWAEARRPYTRRRDAVRGFERFCAAIKKAGKE